MDVNLNRNRQFIWRCENINDRSEYGKFKQSLWVIIYGILVFILGFVVSAFSLNILTDWNIFEEPLSPNIYVSIIGASLSFLTYIIFTLFIVKQCTKDKLKINYN